MVTLNLQESSPPPVQAPAMQPNKPRNRVVVFRLSQEEYRALKEATARVGARNLSDFVRSGILEYLQADIPNSQLSRRFASLEQQVAILQCQIKHLLQGVIHAQATPQA